MTQISDTLFSKAVNELWQAMEVEAGYEQVLEVALGNLLQAKVLNNLTELNTTPKQALNIWLLIRKRLPFNQVV